jgi:molybdopterin synthase catalytic subunit
MADETYLTDEPIDNQSMIDAVLRPSDGGLALFAGVVRNHHEGKTVTEILYEAYRPMAEKEMAKIVRELSSRFPEVRIKAVHRLGLLKVGEASIVITCASPHRAEAFEACREVIDRIKETVPIWKKERGPDGEEWVGWQGG